MKHLKKVLSFILIAAILIPMTLSAAAEPTVSTAKLLVDDRPVSASAYNIDGNTYYKLRDLAYMLNGSAKEFNVSYDDESAAITVIPGEAYAAIGGECSGEAHSAESCQPSKASLYFNGEERSLTSYNINGYTYYKLRDIMLLLDVYVGWSARHSTISLETDRAYHDDSLPLLSTEEVARSARAAVTILLYDEEYNQIGQASGFFISEDGLVATCYHSIEGAHSVLIVTDSGKKYNSTLIYAYDVDRDLAIIGATLQDGEPTPAIPLGNSATLARGQQIMAISSPKGLYNTVATGIISAFRTPAVLRENYEFDIQVTTPISQGSSGGVVLDMYGQAVGVIYAVSLVAQNANYIIPINELLPLVEEAVYENAISFRALLERSAAEAAAAEET